MIQARPNAETVARYDLIDALFFDFDRKKGVQKVDGWVLRDVKVAVLAQKEPRSMGEIAKKRFPKGSGATIGESPWPTVRTHFADAVSVRYNTQVFGVECVSVESGSDGVSFGAERKRGGGAGGGSRRGRANRLTDGSGRTRICSKGFDRSVCFPNRRLHSKGARATSSDLHFQKKRAA